MAVAYVELEVTKGMKVGLLAKRTGVSVRTLHYYDQIGLLSPSAYTAVGHRLYTAGDIVRLQQIKSLQQLGFSLDEIRACLDGPNFSPQEVIRMHISGLTRQIEMQKRVCNRLRALAAGMNSAENVSVERFLEAIEEINKMENRFTPEQMQYLTQRGETLGQGHIREVEAEWPRLIEQVRAEMDNGTDPADERVQKLANRWRELINEFTGGNKEIENVMKKGYEDDPSFGGPAADPRMKEYMVYISRAWAAGKKG
ncbi:MAG: MerR family transcriptional regulator [Chloroflexota bacterium]|nr:MerR family transcriptional regulator [Chloroflexota bacterium]